MADLLSAFTTTGSCCCHPVLRHDEESVRTEEKLVQKDCMHVALSRSEGDWS